MAQFISSIRIKNFRSVVDEYISLDDESLTIFVGRNDAGKSNILKALNLFFNGKTDAETSFRFDDDYSFVAGTGKGKAREVLVELTIEPPKRLQSAKTVRWAKTWRSDNLEVETKFSFYDGSSIGTRSGIYQWLRKLKYRYVPAEKGTAYFPQLMSELHDVLNDVHAIEFNESAFGFVGEIQNISEDLASEIEDLIGLPSRIQAPSDFRMLFTSLDFGENYDGRTYHLRRRGDGIRAWHIPIILKVMARKEQEASQSGRVNPDTIWGFEEPENNLELSNAFKVAQQIHEFSADIQIFLTTHSPAFYALPGERHSRAKTYYLAKDDRITHLVDFDAAEIDEQMGVLDLITPYVKDAYDEKQRLALTIEEMTAVVEGMTARAITKPVFVLSEDEDNELLKVLVRSSGITDFEVQPYEGCSNISGAFSMARMIRAKAPGTHVIVHRDRDYLSSEEIEDLEAKAQRAECTLFLTVGTDLETHFLITAYIAAVGDVSEDEAGAFIDAATNNTRTKSLDKFSGTILNAGRRPDQNWTVSKFEREYDSDPLRYRHGKSVLGELKRIFQKETGRNLTIGQEHECLTVPEIMHVSLELALDPS